MILTILIIYSNHCEAQVIKGTWTGNYAQSILENISRLVIEFEIKNDSIISGKSHLYYPNNNYELHALEGIYRKKDSTVYFEETLESTSISAAAPVVYFMKLFDDGTQWRLQGFWKWKSNKTAGYKKSNSVWLIKQKVVIARKSKPNPLAKQNKVTDKNLPVFKQRKEVASKPSPPVIVYKPDQIPEESANTNKPFTRVQEIKSTDKIYNDIRLSKFSEVQSTIIIKPEEKDSINIAIYDNGEIDNDSISVYFNSKPIKLQLRISANPYSFRIALPTGRSSNEIKIIAENLGSIPPNTALMIITTKTKRYEVRLSSNFDKNAVVKFVLE